MAEIALLARSLFVLSLVVTTGCADTNNPASVASSTAEAVIYKRIQPTLFTAEDGKEYQIINFPNFVQEAVAIECSPARRACQQDYKLHQFMSVPAGKQLFELSELQFRLFPVPYGCKCSA